MSACSASRLGARAEAIAACVLAMALACAGAAHAKSAPSAAAGDSEHVLKSFVIDENGIRIKTAARNSGAAGVDIRIDPSQVHPRVMIGHRDSGRSIHISGGHTPGIVVDTGGSGLVRVFADADVPAGERVEGDVVAVFGSVLVRGSVS